MKTNERTTVYTVTTRKTKCNGRIFKGYTYDVKITDGENTAYFLMGKDIGGKKISFDNLCEVENKYNSRFNADREKHSLKRLYRWGTNKEATYKRQASDALRFVDELIARDIDITYADEGEKVYTV